MTPPIAPLFMRSLRGWLSAKGFWLVLAASLLPLVLTGAWVGTHRADVAAEGVTWTGASLHDGDAVRFTALVRNVGPVDAGPFNVSLAVGTVANNQLFAVDQNDITVDHLAPGESRPVTLEWNATAGSYYVLAFADDADVLGEVDEYNNQQAAPLVVAYQPPAASDAPAAPANLTGDANATTTTALSIAEIRVPDSGATRDLQAVVKNDGPDAVTNATVVLRVGTTGFGGALFPDDETTTNVDLAPGATTVVDLSWTTRPGAAWVEAYVSAPSDARDPDAADNHAAKSVVVDPPLPQEPPKPPEKLTIKEFYLQVLTLLHLKVLLPLVALFYAAGVIADEREKRTLTYLLTRPTPRWVYPLLKFSAGFLAAAVATFLGLVATYALLFGSAPGASDVGFLTTPILASLLTLFAYGALFTLMGIMVARPYLVGLAFVIGWENAAPIFVPFVRNFTLDQHLANALSGWHLDEGLQWVPTGDDALRGFLVLVAAGVAFLVASAYAMKRREFEL